MMQEMGLRPKTPSRLRPAGVLEAVKETGTEFALGCLSVGLRGRQHINSLADRLACRVGFGKPIPSLLWITCYLMAGWQSVSDWLIYWLNGQLFRW